jgi:serine/threonine protein kinase
MPPESLANREYSEKSDVWAFGVTLYVFLAAVTLNRFSAFPFMQQV